MLGLPPFRDIPTDEDDPQDVAPVILDGGGTIVDGPLTAVPRDEQGVIPEPDGQPALDDLPDRLFDRPIGQLQVEDDAIRWGVKLGEPFGDRSGFKDFPTAEGEDSSQDIPGR